MSLFERSGLILQPEEKVIRRGKCEGKVPGGEKLGVKYGIRGGLVKKIQWNEVKGEMVLTNKRVLVLGEKGRLRKEVVPYLDLELGSIKAVTTSKPLVGKEKMSLSIDLGTGKLETMEFKMDDAPGWVSTIRGQIVS